MIKKLRVKFIVINMSIVTIMICIILGLVYHFTRANLEKESINMMQNIAGRPFQLGEPNELGEDVRLPYFTLKLGMRGELMATDGGYYDLSNDEFLNNLIDEAVASSKQFGIIKEYRLRYYHVKTPLNQCIVFADISSELATLNSLMKTCFLIGGLSFLVFLGISIMLAGWAVKPIDLAWKQQQQFVADASHELKTPLTVIMTNAELMQSSAFSEENKAKFLSGILTMSKQMRGLIEQMLELARADNTQIKAAFDSMDFSKLISDAILPFEPVFFERGQILKAQIEENIKVFGSGAQLGQVLEILLDNAQKYSKDSGTTWISLERKGKGSCVLAVANEGDKIKQKDLKNIFKRFYRVDKARSRTGSFGLGLSIADSIIRQHKGKIWAESENGINYFYVELPCS